MALSLLTPSPVRSRIRSAHPLLLLICGLAAQASGCSVDERVLTPADAAADRALAPPPAILIDDFEQDAPGQSGATPSDPRFQVWQYYHYNTAMQTSSMNVVSPGFDSNQAMELGWVVTDPPDGAPNYPGIGFRTLVNGYIDLSQYSKIVLAHLYVHRDGCQAVQNLAVSVACSQYNASFGASIPMSPTWTTSTVNLADLAVGVYPPPPAPVELADCLKVVDGLNFVAQRDLTDGDCASGDLTFDNVSIR